MKKARGDSWYDRDESIGKNKSRPKFGEEMSVTNSGGNLETIGDLNEFLSELEKEGGSENFRDALDQCGLKDLGFSSPKFTWSKKWAGGRGIESLNHLQE
ncbi:hypothetical protein Ddye_029517 [Dipteronia dyeriana]|uniref:Uncharacterized protein n=1 Tax=Dipteronia dyeriana TaxID=168575 RepID=A0AAD9WLS8_9ROSI|nr:hypothetical protein Ddye_029517 [Dipteronia dyeriana]